MMDKLKKFILGNREPAYSYKLNNQLSLVCRILVGVYLFYNASGIREGIANARSQREGILFTVASTVFMIIGFVLCYTSARDYLIGRFKGGKLDLGDDPDDFSDVFDRKDEGAKVNNMGKRVIFIVMDSFGIGEAPDADKFSDAGTNTLKSCISSKFFKADNLKKLGFFNIDGVKELGYTDEEKEPLGAYARMQEKSAGKDTTIGHWEIAGLISENPLPTYPDGFPQEVLDEFTKHTGRGVLCNRPYSGTQVINDYGDEHVKTGDLIVYTSADSVFQIAAHEDVVPVEQLYEYCRIARKGLIKQHGVGRVIARPFIGTSGNYTRTSRRHDFSLLPPGDTMLDNIVSAGKASIGIGKIYDIFAGKGITEYTYTSGNEDGINKTLEYMDKDFEGILFVNLVDYDMLYGHRRDIDGYAKAVAYFDDRLSEIMAKMRDDDVLMITADHGCDPGYTKSTDHTREYVPFVMYGKNIKSANYGTRHTFADMGRTVLEYLDVPATIAGEALI